jgi:hypothetical protein
MILSGPVDMSETFCDCIIIAGIAINARRTATVCLLL